MKRIIISWLVAVSAWLTATATNTITLTSAQGHPGEEVEIAVTLTNSDEVTALEILVPLNDMLRYVDGSAVLNAERSNGHTLTASAKDGNLSICIYNFSLAPVKGTGGEICRFKVKLGKEPADYDLVPEVVLSDKSGISLDCSVSRGVVTLLSPKIEIITPTLAYGRVPIRSSYTKTLTIRNSGNEPLEISEISLEGNDLSASPATCNIGAGAIQNIIVTYSPIQRGDVTKNVTITSNAINPKAGKAVVTAQPFSVNELHVQRAEGISDEEVTVVLKMNNMEPIAGAQCSFKMPKELVYVEGSASAGAMCSNTNHVALGSLQGDVLTLMLYSATNSVIPEGNGELMTFRVRLDGRSGSYSLNPTDVVLSNMTMENMVSATSSNYVVIKSPAYSASTTLDMGKTPVTEKQTCAYSIKNNGSVDLVISRVSFLAEGYSVETELPLTIAPGQSKSIEVSYTPTREGEHKTTMQVYTNDPNNRMFSVAVSGKVYEPNRISVSGENIRGGYRFAFGLDNYTDIVAVQMNISWLPGMKTSPDMLVPGERMKNHSYLLTDLGGGVCQLLIYSMANTPILGNEGELFTLVYKDVDGATYRDTDLRVTDIVLSDAKGTNYVSEAEVSTKASFSNFTLRFVVDGEVVDEQFLKVGSMVVAPEVQEREGHSFAWVGLPETMPAKDVEIVGSFSANKYQLTYVVDGVVLHSDSIVYGSKLAAIDEPEKEGHTFSGWSEIPETMPAKDVEIVGSFRANKYQLTYVVDGVVFHSDSIVYGSKLAAIDEPEKEGHTFCGWSEMPETMPARDVTISGSFTINKYLVMFVADEQVVYSDSLEYGSPIVIPDAPNKEGHTFKGWGDVEETVPAFDVTYRANYVVNVYKVYYYVGEKLVHTEEVAYSDEIPEYVYIPENEDEEFVGWIGEVYSTMPAHDLVYVANINTGIGEVETESGERKSKIFDLSGRRVKDVQKGIYIVNGKKVMM